MMIKLIEKISASIGFIIFAWSVTTYVTALIQKPLDKMANVGLSAFALVAAVSGLCFAMASVVKEENNRVTLIYSGEELLHSTVMVLELLVLKYVSDTLLNSQFVQSRDQIQTIIEWTSYMLLFFLSCYAAFFSLYGFKALHDYLWSRFKTRSQTMNNA